MSVQAGSGVEKSSAEIILLRERLLKDAGWNPMPSLRAQDALTILDCLIETQDRVLAIEDIVKRIEKSTTPT